MNSKSFISGIVAVCPPVEALRLVVVLAANLFAVTVTGTATATPTPSSTSTSSPASDDEQTGTEIPIPAPLPDQVGGVIVDQLGNPVSGVRVILVGIGEALTDENGAFMFTGVLPATIYTVFAQKSGVAFTTPSLAVSSGAFVTFTAAFTSFNPLNCPSTDCSASLVDCSKVAEDLRNDTLTNVKKIPKTTRLRLLSGEVIQALELPQRVDEQFQNYQAASQRIPEIALQCTSGRSCVTTDLSPFKFLLMLELQNLSHERLLVNRILRFRSRIGQKESSAVVRATQQARARALRIVEGFVDASIRCPS